MITVALPINAKTADLITALNGGSRPGEITYGKYYVCDIEDGVTSNRQFTDREGYREMGANRTIKIQTFVN